MEENCELCVATPLTLVWTSYLCCIANLERFVLNRSYVKAAAQMHVFCFHTTLLTHNSATPQRLIVHVTSPYEVAALGAFRPSILNTSLGVETRHVLRAGQTFSKPARLIITEKPTAYGKYWTWVHWELEVTTSAFLNCDEVTCRAWDWSQNTQPAALTWTLLGQGNNSMFRLKCHKEVDEQVCSQCASAPLLCTAPAAP
jgi:hypothetical protein